MANFDDIFPAPVEEKKHPSPRRRAGNRRMNPDEWAAKKKEERLAAYELADKTTGEIFANGNRFTEYLDLQSRLDRYSVTNVLLKALQNIMKQDKEKFRVPKGVQDAIPVRTIWKNGIFLVGNNKYSKTFQFTDINYGTASDEDKKTMFLAYSELLNSFDSNATTKITIVTRKLNRRDFERNILIPEKKDGLDRLRREYNDMLMDIASSSSCMIRDMYITVSAVRKSYEDAKNYFARVGSEMSMHLSRLGSRCKELDADDRLRILHGFYRHGEEADYCFDLQQSMKKGHSFKDYICPDSMEFESDHFKVGERFGRVMYLKDYASFIKDDFISELCSIDRPIIMSVDVIPVPTDEAVREGESRLLGVERNVVDFLRKQQNNNNFSGTIPYDLEKQRAEIKEFLDDLTSRDQRMMFANLTYVHTADTKEQLDSDTENVQTFARRRMCQMATLKFQQLDGLNTALPIGVRKIDAMRTLTTESLAVLMPFRVQEIMDAGGIFYGVNAISGNLILCNKSNLLNQSAFILGVPGSGKSFSVKELIVFIALATGDDILVCDPEGEYQNLMKVLGAEIIKISAGSPHHINAMDMVEGYGDGSNPVIDKSEFVLSLFEQLDPRGIDPHEKSIIDRCVDAVYREYKKGGAVPTLRVLRKKLLAQPEEEAQRLALSLELFTSGSLNAFAHETNVDTQNRMVVYDIHDLGRQLKTMGLLVITDAMLNRVTENWRKGKRTHVIVDEFHVVFENEHSAEFFSSAWRRFRKRNAYPTAITQNVEYLLDSVEASTMLSNSEFIVMLNQAASDREKLADKLNISEEQLGYITNAEAGCGLIRYGSALVPFKNRFPKNTELYKLMTTKPGENL